MINTTTKLPKKSIYSALSLYVATFVLATLTAWFALDLFDADFTKPFEYSGDALSTAAHFKTVFETGWYENQSLLGAPNGQVYHDFPTADNLHFIAAKLFSLFTADWAIGFNGYYVLGYPLAAITALWFFRLLKVSAPIAVALSVAFSIAPYHFQRGEAHLWLSSYYAVPLGAGILILALQNKKVWGRGSSENKYLAWLLSPTARTLLFLALLATSSSYYGVFFILLMTFVVLFQFIQNRNFRQAFKNLATAGFTALIMLVNMAPDIIYSAVNGINPSGLQRSPGEIEYYGIKLTQLLMPWSGHRIPALRELRGLYDSHYPLSGENPALGILGATGLTISLLISAFAILGYVKFKKNKEFEIHIISLFGLGFLIFVSLLFSFTGGLSTVTSFFTSSLRGWNRMSIVILLFCLGVLAIVLHLWIARSKKSINSKTFISIGLSIILIVVAFIDQTPRDSHLNQTVAATNFDLDAQWIETIESSQPENALVLQLPYVPFPESATVTGIFGSEQLVPYLHSDTIQWSGGGVKGRTFSDYPGILEQYPPQDIALLSAASGFTGILIDKGALYDGGIPLIEGLEATLGEKPLVSDSQRFVFFSLEEISSTLNSNFSSETLNSIKDIVVNPPIPYLTTSFDSFYDDESKNRNFRNSTLTPEILLTNNLGYSVPGFFAIEVNDVYSESLKFVNDGKEIIGEWNSNVFSAPIEATEGVQIITLQDEELQSGTQSLVIRQVMFYPSEIMRFLSEGKTFLAENNTVVNIGAN